MSPRRASLIAALGVLIVALLVVAYLVARGARSSNQPVSAATAVAEASPVPTQAATPTAEPPVTSRPPTARTTPAPTPTGQAILSFGVPQTVECDAARQDTPNVHLSWTTANATGVTISIDGPGKYDDYPATGSADVPFACSVPQHTYQLTTEGSGTPATRMVVVKRA